MSEEREPLLSLRALEAADRIHEDDWVWITPEERTALITLARDARALFSALDRAHEIHFGNPEMLRRIDFAIGTTLVLRRAVEAFGD